MSALAIAQEPPGPPRIAFEMHGETNRFIELEANKTPDRIHFIAPVKGRTIRAADPLPQSVRWRLRRLLVVKEFRPGGLLIDEHLSNIEIRADVYYP
jgi:hypothetical protein